MRMRLALVLLVSTAFTPAFAADIAAISHIDAVTVFPSGAEVTRVAEQKLEAGDHSLIFEGLPGDLQPETIRVEGTSEGNIEIGSVDSKLVYVPSTETDARRKTITGEIETLQDERAVLDQTIADAEYQKSLMQQLASGAFTQPTKEGEVKSFGAQDLGSLLELVGGKLQIFSKTILDSKVRQRAIDATVQDLQTALNELAPQEQARTVVTVHLAAPAVSSGVFRLKYRIAAAGWRPIYDARLTSPDKTTQARIELVRRAEVMQSTTESWSDVALTLSTARPVGSTAAPDLEPYRIAFQGEPTRRDVGGLQDGLAKMDAPKPASTMALDGALEEKGKKENMIVQAQAEVQVAGFQALYGIAGRVSIDNTGTAKKVRISTDTLDAKLSARAVPKLDPNAYLTASFTLKGETPLLPGVVMLYRDGVFMGQGAIPMLSPGEETRLGFGADDLIKVQRAEVKRLSGEEGIITTSNVDTRAYDIAVKNLHDFAVPVTILDQMPVSAIEDITVETLAGMTPPTVKDFDKKPGVLAWSFDLDAKAGKLIKHGFKVTMPQNLRVGMNIN